MELFAELSPVASVTWPQILSIPMSYEQVLHTISVTWLQIHVIEKSKKEHYVDLLEQPKIYYKASHVY